MQAKPLQFLLGEEHDCDYLPGRPARSAFLIANRTKTGTVYQTLIKQGFRRSGDLIYRPCCRGCQSCVSVRIPVEQFTLSRIQRRTWKKNADLIVKTRPPVFNEIHFELYRRYLSVRHPGGSMSESGPEDYIRFLSSDWAGTLFYEFATNGQVVAVAVMDNLGDTLSAVYTFFDPRLSKRSLGSYTILWGIEETRRLGFDALYLGYWIDVCPKMAYKNNYKPTEGYIDGRWQLTTDH